VDFSSRSAGDLERECRFGAGTFDLISHALVVDERFAQSDWPV
jgi:hypothetical protein